MPHHCVSQAVSELKRCPVEYLNDFGGLKMTLLAGRKHSCTHKMAAVSRNVDEDCKRVRTAGRERGGGGCALEARAFAVRGNLPAAWDVEDLVAAAKASGGCGYYASRGEQQAKAHVVFAPYAYLVDPGIRKSMGINLKASDRTCVRADEKGALRHAAAGAA